MSSAAVFAVGFVMRPIGAWLFGIYADRKGRKAGLTLSVSLMCGGSLLIAAAPTYASAGLLSPAILVLARMIQGLSLGGEYGSSATYLSEMAGRERRGFWSSFQYVTLIAGQLVALALLLMMQATMSEAALEGWGWRLAFLVGALLAVVVFFIRRRLSESPSFDAKSSKTSSGKSLFRDHPREALLVMALTAGGTLAFYAYTTYMQKYLANTVGFDRVTASRIMTAALFVFMLLQPVGGLLSDRFGRKPVMIAFGIAGMVLTVPIFTALETTTLTVGGVRAGHGEPRDRDGLHLDQRGGEGRTVPEPHPRARGGAALCAGQHDLRRDRRICRLVAQGRGPRAVVLLLCRGDDRAEPGGLCDDARDAHLKPDRRGLMSAPCPGDREHINAALIFEVALEVGAKVGQRAAVPAALPRRGLVGATVEVSRAASSSAGPLRDAPRRAPRARTAT